MPYIIHYIIAHYLVQFKLKAQQVRGLGAGEKLLCLAYEGGSAYQELCVSTRRSILCFRFRGDMLEKSSLCYIILAKTIFWCGYRIYFPTENIDQTMTKACNLPKVTGFYVFIDIFKLQKQCPKQLYKLEYQ